MLGLGVLLTSQHVHFLMLKHIIQLIIGTMSPCMSWGCVGADETLKVCERKTSEMPLRLLLWGVEKIASNNLYCHVLGVMLHSIAERGKGIG